MLRLGWGGYRSRAISVQRVGRMLDQKLAFDPQNALGFFDLRPNFRIQRPGFGFDDDAARIDTLIFDDAHVFRFAEREHAVAMLLHPLEIDRIYTDRDRLARHELADSRFSDGDDDVAVDLNGFMNDLLGDSHRELDNFALGTFDDLVTLDASHVDQPAHGREHLFHLGFGLRDTVTIA